MSSNEYYFSTGNIQPNSAMRIKKSNYTFRNWQFLFFIMNIIFVWKLSEFLEIISLSTKIRSVLTCNQNNKNKFYMDKQKYNINYGNDPVFLWKTSPHYTRHSHYRIWKKYCTQKSLRKTSLGQLLKREKSEQS